ncbi:MAG TPA: bifunctional nuclease family protein [Actinomycetota bacterium]|jgi:bifunctional DNase/RNase|nr:bifunctional nuclease family protein [Actinomycetota bacterium]
MIEMTVAGVRIEFPSNSPIVLLREAEGERFLPIWIGQSEAQAIAIGQQGLATPRPMTHDLLKNILDEMAVQVTSITITELRDGVFHAVIGLQRNGSSYEISSRPSDAIALAVRLDCKIFANEDVLEEASILIPPDGEGEPEEEKEKQVQEFREFLENVTPDDFE